VLQNRHDRVVEILYGVCRAHRPYTAVYADHLRAPFKPIGIPAGKGGEVSKVYHFRPDVWARLSNGKIDVIEVWDEQSEAGGVQDLILTALTPRLNSMTIVCFDEAAVAKAKELASAVLSAAYNGSGSLLLDPSEVARRVILVPEKIQSDDAAIKQLVKDRLRATWTRPRTMA